MLCVYGSPLYQWDRNRQLQINSVDIDSKFEVHCAHSDDSNALVVEPKIEGDTLLADIPNILLQRSGYLRVYVVTEGDTIYDQTFYVMARQKPADYIYTPEELKTWEDLQNQIGNLENLNTEAKDNLVNAINELLLSGGAGGNGVGIEKIEQTTKSTEDDGENIITVTLTNSQKYTFSVFNGSKGSKGDKGDKGEQGAKGENGKSAFEYAVEGGYLGDETQFGKDLGQVQNKITSPETAQIGQTIVVKAVNDAMQPTEWETANLPTGGGEEWELIADDTLQEDVIELVYTNLNHKNIYILIDGMVKDITYEGYNYKQAMIRLDINGKQCMKLTDSMMFVNQKDKGNWHIDKVANTCRVLFHRVLSPSNGAGMCINADIPDCSNGINSILLSPNLSQVYEGVYQNLGRFTAGTNIKIYGIKN